MTDEPTIAAMLDWLRLRVSPTEVESAERILRGTGTAQDEPPPFSGRPRPGGTMDPLTAQDSRPGGISARLTRRIGAI